MRNSTSILMQERFIIKKCHVCGHLNETACEPTQCGKCGKSFLPLQYFTKIQENAPRNHRSYLELYSHSSEIMEEDLVHGLYVLW